MTRKPSAHYVTLLDINKWEKSITNMMFKAGKISNDTKMEAGWKPLGLIVKNNKHYLIDHDGVGSFEPLEKCSDSIDWYEHTYIDGKMTSFNIMPTAQTTFDYKDLVNENIIEKKRVRLDRFIRTFGIKLDGNCARIERFLDGKIDKKGKAIVQKLKTAEN